MNLAQLSTPALLDGVKSLLGTERRTLAQLLVHLIEVEERRAHLELACSSLFDFCVRKLLLSEGEAFRRINAARLARRFPVILEMIADGRIHLSALVFLRDLLTEDNFGDLLREAAGKSKTELQKLIASRFPRPDVTATIRKLPVRATATAAAADDAARRSFDGIPLSLATGMTGASKANSATAIDATARSDESMESLRRATPSLQAPTTQLESMPTRSLTPSRRGPTVAVEALSVDRYKVQLTVSADLKEKLERAARLMNVREGGDGLPLVLEKAIDALLTQLEKEKVGQTSRPRRPRQSAEPKYIPRAVRREVFARDGGRCTFVSNDGERCPARGCLEVDHRHPRALGGASSADNLRLLCRAHNHLAAERVFGRRFVAQRVDMRRRKRQIARAKGVAAGEEQALGLGKERIAPPPNDRP